MPPGYTPEALQVEGQTLNPNQHGRFYHRIMAVSRFARSSSSATAGRPCISCRALLFTATWA